MTAIVIDMGEGRMCSRSELSVENIVPCNSRTRCRVIETELVALAAALHFRPPTAQELCELLIGQFEKKQVRLDKIGMGESLPIIGLNLRNHRGWRVFAVGDAGFDFLVDVFTKRMLNGAKRCVHVHESRERARKVADQHDVGIDIDGDVVIGQKHMRVHFDEARCAGVAATNQG